MSNFGSETGNVLYLIVSAASRALDTVDRVRTEQANGWDVAVIATPSAINWIDQPAIEHATGHQVRWEMPHHADPHFQPLGDAVIVVPATFNTISRIALGLTSNLAVGLACEALGRDIPVTIEPQVGDAFLKHPAYRTHIDTLTSAGAQLLT